MMNELFILIKDVYKTKYLPTNFVKSIIIYTPKKIMAIKIRTIPYHKLIITCFKDTNKNYVKTNGKKDRKNNT